MIGIDIKICMIIGLFLIFVGLALLILKTFKPNRLYQTRFKYLLFYSKKPKNKGKESKHLTLVRLGGAFLFALGIARNLDEFLKYYLFSYIVLFVGITGVSNLRENVRKNKKTKAMAVLFEAIELYMKGGYSLFQSLILSRPLVPELRKEIDTCLDYWPEGPRVALEKFSQTLNMEEGDILISLLIHMEIAGSKDLAGILSREAHNIERLRRMRKEASLSLRPVYLMVYRFLPLISAIGIIAGPLLYRTYRVLTDSGVLGF